MYCWPIKSRSSCEHDTRNRTTHATFVFFEDARRGFDAFLGQLW